MAGRLLIKFLNCIALIFISIATFIYVDDMLGAAAAFLSLAALYLMCAAAVAFSDYAAKKRRLKAREEKAKAERQAESSAVGGASLGDDEIAKFLPQSIKDDPRFQKIIDQVADNPLAATSAAVALGYVISHEFLEER